MSKKKTRTREKICAFCGNSFYDDTKYLSQKNCSKECAFNLMKKKRHEAGNYKRTKIQIENSLQA